MRPLEIAIVGLLIVGALCPLLANRPAWLAWLPLVTLLLTGAHLASEQYRWQMIPLYLLVGVQAVLALRGLLLPSPNPAVNSWGQALGRTIPMLFVVALATLPPVLLPVPKLAEPTGPFSIGTMSFVLVDANRPEIFGSDPTAPRELVAQLWYPAESDPDGPLAPWLEDLDLLNSAIARSLGLPSFSLTHLELARTHAHQNAPLAQTGTPFPVLLFSHGWTGFRTQNTFQMEELASHGYVVAAVDHTYATPATAFPDGRVIANNPAALPSGAPIAELDLAAKKLVAQWIGDLDCLLNHLEILNANDPAGQFTGRLDFDQVGVLGHSTGGGAAIEFCGRDSRCRAGLTMDAFVLPVSEQVLATGLEQPFLFMWSQDWPWETNTRRFQQLETNLTGISYQITIDGTAHYDFSDLPLMTPLASTMGLKGPLNGSRALRIINDFTLAFFDHHLRGQDGPPLYFLEPDYPEVRFKLAPIHKD